MLELQAAKTALQRGMIVRAKNHGGVRVATAIANRPKDQLDLLGLVAVPDVDWDYVDKHAEAWGVQAVVARMRALAAGGT